MKYLLLLNRLVDDLPAPGTPDAAAMAGEYGAAMAELAGAGVLIDSGPLQPASAASVVRVRDGQTLITDLPAAEIKEYLGGYTLIECADLDEAIAWAARIPAAAVASVEIRPVAPTAPRNG